MSLVTIALLQEVAVPNPDKARTQTESAIRKAAAQGAQIICTQELFLSPYFCRTQEIRWFDLAETIPGPTTEYFAPIARELGVVLLLSLFEKRAPGLYHNTTAILDAEGQLLGIYRKMHIPQDPGFEEKFYFAPGDLGYACWPTRHANIGVIICWDQWFPEAARLTALQGADILFCPTAIGWLPEEKPLVGETQCDSWQTVQRGHAIANGCYYAAINRTGTEDPIEFWGHSFVSDYTGQIIAQAPHDQPTILLAECDLQALEDHRRTWPFFRDRRIDSYQPLQQRFGTLPKRR